MQPVNGLDDDEIRCAVCGVRFAVDDHHAAWKYSMWIRAWYCPKHHAMAPDPAEGEGGAEERER